MEEDQFMEIANQTIEKAVRVQCSVGEYVEGLRLIIAEIEIAIQSAREG